LIFEKVTKENCDIDKDDIIDGSDLDRLNNEAVQRQKDIDDIYKQFGEQQQMDTSTRSETEVSTPSSTKQPQANRSGSISSNPTKDLHDLKKKYAKQNIFIYECGQCQKFIMLHCKTCAYCE
jgi:hypothetical protein